MLSLTIALTAFTPAHAQEAAAEPMERYLAQRVSIVDRDVTTVYAKAYDGNGRFWFVEQDGRALDAPTFARLTDDHEVADRLLRRKRGKAAAGATCFVAGAGLGVLGAMLAGPALAPSGDAASGRELVALTALVPPLVGIVGGTVLLGGSFRASHPSAVYTRDAADARARGFNESLRDELFDEPAPAPEPEPEPEPEREREPEPAEAGE